MPTNDFAGLDPHVSIDRAEVNRVGEGWAHSDRVERPDYTLHLPFDKVPPQPPITPQPQPTQAEVREQLGRAIEAQRAAGETLERAEAAHERTEAHLAKCQQRAAQYAGLDQAIAAATIEALRCDAGRLSPDLTEEHELAIDDRARASAELAAAETALATFRAEHAEASAAYGNAAKAADALIARVLAHIAEAIAIEHEGLLERAKMLRGVMVGFDRFATPYHVPIPPTLGRVYGGTDRQAFARQVDASMWRDAADRLRADPTATVSVTLFELLPEPEAA
jgi:hypothetical protein